MLKQDAYGLGAVRLAKRVTAGQGPGGGVELLAVFAPNEARELAEANVTAPVLVLSPVRELDRTDALYRAAAAGRDSAARFFARRSTTYHSTPMTMTASRTSRTMISFGRRTPRT